MVDRGLARGARGARIRVTLKRRFIHNPTAQVMDSMIDDTTHDTLDDSDDDDQPRGNANGKPCDAAAGAFTCPDR